ncbi:MAG UNVERIFIED_CONTAM: hypothetical protein LVR18_08895 [Planctomycetaceae bacterium]|jgi:hypothetical protein
MSRREAGGKTAGAGKKVGSGGNASGLKSVPTAGAFVKNQKDGMQRVRGYATTGR